jgi:hypothetical protein
MTDPNPESTDAALRARVGLCLDCIHAELVPHPRGAEPYRMCRRSKTDPAYPKYPPLPVRVCPGYEKK